METTEPFHSTRFGVSCVRFFLCSSSLAPFQFNLLNKCVGYTTRSSFYFIEMERDYCRYECVRVSGSGLLWQCSARCTYTKYVNGNDCRDEFPAFRAFAMNILSKISRAHTQPPPSPPPPRPTRRTQKEVFPSEFIGNRKISSREEVGKKGWREHVLSLICMRQSIPESINRLDAKPCDNSFPPKIVQC